MANKRGKQSANTRRHRDAITAPAQPLPASVQGATSWQTVHRQNRPLRRRQTDDNYFLTQTDNDAERSWRHHNAYTSTIKIPIDLIRTTQVQEFSEIARRFGAHLALLPERGTGVYGIWASNTAQAQQAKTEVEHWIRQHASSNSKKAFVKLRSTTEKQREINQKDWEEEVDKHKFRQAPPVGSHFETIGTFVWPADDFDAKRQLGNSLEALDGIRATYKCYIILRDDASSFRILGSVKGVRAAITALRQVSFQIVAGQQMTIRAHMAHWQDTAADPASVVPLEIRSSSSTTHGTHGMMFSVDDWEHVEHASIPGNTYHQLNTKVRRVINNIQYYKAQVSFTIRLGTFIATSSMAPRHGCSYEGAEFINMIAQSQFDGYVINPLGSMPRIRFADRLLPCSTRLRRLEDVLPERRAVFTFETKAGNFELTMTWADQLDAVGRYVHQQLSDQWLKLDTDQQRHQLLDVNVLRLDSELAWQFDVNAARNLQTSQLPEALKSFAASVKLQITAKKAAPFVDFAAAMSDLKAVSNVVKYSYQFKDSDWIVDVSQVQTWHYASSKHHLLKINRTDPSYWTCQLHHANWDKMLGGNATLAIGERVPWAPDIADWFPAGTNSRLTGMEECFDKMIYLESILREQEVDSRTGMKVD